MPFPIPDARIERVGHREHLLLFAVQDLVPVALERLPPFCLLAEVRDEAPAKTRAKSASGIRKRVSRAALKGRVIVVPYMLTQGELLNSVAKALQGLRFTWDGRTLLPHEKIAAWVEASAGDGAKLDDMKVFR